MCLLFISALFLILLSLHLYVFVMMRMSVCVSSVSACCSICLCIIVAALRQEITNLSRLVNEGAGLSIGQENTVQELIKQKVCHVSKAEEVSKVSHKLESWKLRALTSTALMPVRETR